MDEKRFDDLSMRLGAARLTRAGALRALVGGVAALAGVGLAASMGEAKGKKTKRKARGRQTSSAQGEGCRPAGHPCEGSQQCCGDLACEVTGPGNAKRCVSGPPPTCGASGEPCCSGHPKCEAGLTCDTETHTCRPNNPECGGEGQACCTDGRACHGDLVCAGDTCVVPCGAAGEICCAGNTCDGDLLCTGGFCVPRCGEQGQACCANGACTSGLVCNSANNTCETCGHEDEICCANDSCLSGLTCDDATTCQRCGSEGELCCGGTACNAGFVCVGTTCQASAPQGCTTDEQCPEGSRCIDGTCVAFGLKCRTGETPQHCCNRSVKKGCKRKQQSAHARKNCLRKGKKRCKRLLAA